MKISKRDCGSLGENMAAHYLRSVGYVILENNFRAGRREIDLIAQKDNLIIFIEVKTRTSRRFGFGEESVSARKRKNLYLAARKFLTDKVRVASNPRFDIICVELREDYSLKGIDHFPDIL